jgi:hypothetical protein
MVKALCLPYSLICISRSNYSYQTDDHSLNYHFHTNQWDAWKEDTGFLTFKIPLPKQRYSADTVLLYQALSLRLTKVHILSSLKKKIQRIVPLNIPEMWI